MKKRKLIIAGGVVTSMLLSSASPARAEAAYSPTRARTTLETIAADLDIDTEDFKEELRQGKTPKQILQEEGFTPAQIKKVFKRSIRS